MRVKQIKKYINIGNRTTYDKVSKNKYNIRKTVRSV